MLIPRSVILLNLVAVICFWAAWEYRVTMVAKYEGNNGPDVIVGVIPGVHRWGTASNQTAFSIATTSCNIGTARLTWIQNSPLHPVISQNMYRVKDGRIEQLGMSWLKHGFSVVAGNACGSCTDPGSNFLGVGCSDPYGAMLNGSHNWLGPRSEVNAATGVFAWPRGSLPQTGLLDGRIRVQNSDLNPALNAGARYFVESQYVHPEDAAAGNGNNNASYREVFVSSVSGGWTVNTSGSAPTVQMQPAINAWQAVHPDVKLFTVDIPGDGRVIVGLRTIPIAAGSGFRTEIAIENLNSHRSIRSLGVEYGSSVITNPGFNDVDYQHEPYSNEDWTPTILDNQIQWATDTFDVNPNANAIRWSTLYSFWCDSELPPRQLSLGIFRPGDVEEMVIDLMDAVVPETYEFQAEVAGGQFENILSSDGQYFQLGPSNKRFKRPTVQLQLDAALPTTAPVDLAFRLEAMVSGKRFEDVDQTIEMLDHTTGEYEVVDSRPAERNPSRLEITPRGGLSRFVHSKTGMVSARIQWTDPEQRPRQPTPWTVDIDHAAWLFSE